jgi:NAD(P)H-flavin reductase
MVYDFGRGEIPLSLSRIDPASGLLHHTVRRVGAVSKALASKCAGDMVGIRGPFGQPWPMAQLKGRNLVLLAGGLGIAPLKPVIEIICQDRAAYGEVVVIYGSRDPSVILYEDSISGWREAGIELQVTMDFAPSGWRGHVGNVVLRLSEVATDWATNLVLMCGPEIMMRFALAKLKDLGSPLQNISLSLERNMKCAIGLCGHCQFSSHFICRDGPVLRADQLEPYLWVKEL